MAIIEIFCGILVACLAFYYYLVNKYDFWTKRGIRGPKPIPLFGTFKDVLLSKISISDHMADLYKKYKHEPMIGLFMRRQLVMGIHDPDLIKTILIKDFATFSNRGIALNNVTEPLSQNMFFLEPKRWRPIRSRLSPVFTSGKLKEMFSLIIECADVLENNLDTLAASGEPIDFRELAARFTTDVIGSSVFGINMHAMSDKESKFREVGKEFFEVQLKSKLRIILRESWPRLYTFLGYILPRDKITKFFMSVVLDMIDYRKKNDVTRHDFINVLMDLQKHPEKLGDVKLTESLLVSQAFVFFVAGFETSSTAISNTLYELARNQDIQDKLREEIREYYEKCNGEWQYENVNSMPFLNLVFKESLRLHPPVPLILRKAMESYTFKGTKVTIPKDTRIFISVYGIHRDPEIYPNPEVFDTDRFKEDVAATRHPMHYLPFGDGPRNCIGARFATFQTKIGLIKILRNYKVDVCEQTQIPYINDPAAFLLAPNHGIVLKLSKVET
ncbi:cytochrome P450 6a2-like [Calliopsis andreniformis]|uniref:cytochrome P450 6a2-like n=1 Tax=Calliopsis andreniformis TaxID=337506 RepID=UPI003FCEB9BB